MCVRAYVLLCLLSYLSSSLLLLLLLLLLPLPLPLPLLVLVIAPSSHHRGGTTAHEGVRPDERFAHRLHAVGGSPRPYLLEEDGAAQTADIGS